MPSEYRPALRIFFILNTVSLYIYSLTRLKHIQFIADSFEAKTKDEMVIVEMTKILSFQTIKNQIAKDPVMNIDQMIKKIFEDGRTHRFFQDKPVAESVLHKLYEIAKVAPSASNLCPMRITFVVTAAQKQKVIEAAADGNKPKIISAPVVAIIAHDAKFYDHVETLAPHMDGEAFRLKDKIDLEQIAVENSWLQAGFLIAAARALGLDCGPMSGFSKAKIDDVIYKGSSWRSNFLMNIGYGDSTKLHPRGHRFSFKEGYDII